MSESAINENETQLPILTEDLIETLNASNRGGKLICVVGSSRNDTLKYELDEAQKYAQGLLQMNYNRVCTLHKGIEAFRILAGSGDDVIVVPNV